MNLDELKALAENATPGPWEHIHISYGIESLRFGEQSSYDDPRPGGHIEREADAKFIAAVNPSVVLELIKTLRDYSDKIEVFRLFNWLDLKKQTEERPKLLGLLRAARELKDFYPHDGFIEALKNCEDIT